MENPMLKKLMTLYLAAALAMGSLATTTEQAEARRGAGVAAGVAAGIIGLGILGAAANANRYDGYYGARPACYLGPRECYYTGQRCWYNRYGEYVCGRGQYRCHRPTICP
jgi:hypothetical protein